MFHLVLFIVPVLGTPFFSTCPKYPGGDTLDNLPVLPPGPLPHTLSNALNAVRDMVGRWFLPCALLKCVCVGCRCVRLYVWNE